MTYSIRNPQGTKIANVNNLIANHIIKGVPGFFRPAKYQDGTEKIVYEISKDYKTDHHGFEFFLLKGYTIVPS